ncbi:hypothetical protein ASE63_22320 [Bosea sp. Root381]|uniref:hypothetical protein n=1 Tax=Bosea sp. Root381 TaxID=1736524 RepID=UPI0006FD4B5A|nr:hypothetical protein [Bosea sp. Root381]KRE07437.1 hypothetical protein ASE63_22320 [Bosea sp. Root381]
MSRPAAKPADTRDPIIGRRIRVLRGPCAGKEGRAVNAYRQRVATPDRIMIELDGFLPGWGIKSLLTDDIEILP